MMDKDLFLEKMVFDIASKNLETKDLQISIPGKDESGNGYFGDIIKINAKGKNRSLDMVVKASLRNDVVRAVVPVDEAFNNELLFYKDIFPAMTELQTKLGIQNIFNSVPRFLEWGEHGDYGFIAMENLTKTGFNMFDFKDDVDDEHLKMICQLFGKFHALSFAFKLLKPELYESLVKKLQSVPLGFLRYKGGFLKQCVSVIKSALEKRNCNNIIVDYYVENIENIYRNVLAVSSEDEYSCIIHYDGWLNNLMFKYKDMNGSKIPVDIKLFDWQTCSVGSPAVDLSIALYTIASKAVLENLEKYLRIYHKAFRAFLSQTGLHVETVYPFRVLKEQWQKYSEFGVIRGLLVQKIRMNVGGVNQTFEEEMNGEFNVEDMQKLLNSLLKHLQNIKVF